MDFRKFRFNDIIISSGRRGMKRGFLLTEKPNTDGGSITYSERNYIDTDGADYDDIHFAPRDFDVRGAIIASNNNDKNHLKHQLVMACNPKQPIDLFYYNGRGNFYAKAMTVSMPEFGEEMPGILPFIIPMRIPGFYWLSHGEEQHNIFRRTEELKTTFTLPAVFSSRQSEADVRNDGDVLTYPIFRIICNEIPTLSEVRIENLTTNKFICLNYQAQKNEIITIDCNNCSVISSINGNILNHITAESEFFALDIGQNSIKCTLPGAVVASTHRCRYLEA